MRPVESSLPAVTHNAPSTALTRESRRVAAAASRGRFVLLTVGLACWVAGAATAAEPIDLDTGFGGNGVLYAPVDAPNSTSRDRTVAVYQEGSAAYVVVAETANASGGYSPTFIRLTSAGVQSRNTVNLNMIGINAACQDPATGGFVVGMRTTSMNGNAITFRKYDAAGIQDMTFGANGSGNFTYGAGVFERVAEMNCHSGGFSAATWLGDTDGNWTGNSIVRGAMVGGTLGFVRNDNPSEVETIQTLGSGTTDDDEVIFVNKLDRDFQPQALQVFQYASTLLNTVPTVATIVVGEHCDLGSTSTVDRAHVDNNGRVHVAGSSIDPMEGPFTGRRFNWLMQFSVPDSGTVGAIRCGTYTYSPSGSLTPKTNTVEAFEFTGQSVYMLTTLATSGILGTTSTPGLLRFQSGSGGLNPDLFYLPSLATSSGNTTPTHRGRTLMFDVRPTVPRLLLGGDRDFQNLDEDPFLVRMITAPMFANGFE